MARPAVRTFALSKQFGATEALRDLDFEVGEGEVVGVLGPNGAGKTTTIRMLLGLIAPTAGSGEVLGADLGQPRNFLHRVGAMIESPAF